MHAEKEFRPYIRRARLIADKGADAVYDGDGTVHVYVDQGFYVERFRIALRLARIDAPEIRGGNEMTRKKARAARDRLYGILNEGPFWIDSLGKGKYGRWLVDIYLDGTCVNDLMVTEGHAVYKDYS